MQELASIGEPVRPGQGQEELRALVQVILDINRSLDLDQVLQAALTGIQRVVGADAGGFALLESRPPLLLLSQAASLPHSLLVRLEALANDPHLLADAVQTENRSTIISTVAQQVAKILQDELIESFMLVPLTALGRAVGVLLVLNQMGHVLRPQSVDLLMSIGEQVGRAIENAQLHASVSLSDEWHRTFIESSPDAFWEGDFDHGITYVNDAACRLLGYERDVLLGMKTTDFIIADDWAGVGRSELLEKGSVINRDAKVRTSSGQVRIINYSSNVVRDDRGNVVRYRSISRDVTERRALSAKLAQRNQELAALNRIAEILSDPLSLDQSLNQVCEQIVTIMNLDAVALCLIDEKREFLNLAAERGLNEVFVSQVRRLGLDDPATRRIAIEGQILCVDDAAALQVPGFAGPKAEGFHAGIGMPIKRKGESIGAIFVGSRTLTRLEPSSVDLLQNISLQIGVALENQRLYKEMQRRVDELVGLAQLSEACTASLDPQAIFDLTVDWTQKLLDVDVADLRLLEGQLLRIGGSKVREYKPGYPKEIALGDLYHPLIENHQPLVVNDWENDPDVPDLPSRLLQSRGFRAVLSVAMSAREHVIGTLTVACAQAHPWTKREIDLLQTIANQVANALDNALLFQNVLREGRKVEAILDSGLSGLYATDAQGKIVLFNRAAERMTGWTLSQVQGRDWKELFEDPNPLIYSALERKESVYHRDERNLRVRDGRSIPVAEAVAPLFDEKGEVTGAVGAFWDLTREKSAELSRERFLTMVAHQLRSPLSALLSALQLLESRRLPAQRRSKLWSVIKRDGERLKKFANEFLELEETIKSPRPLHMEPMPIVAVTRDLVAKFQAASRGNKMRVRSEQPEIMVLADMPRYENVLLNLLDNAVSYSPEKSTVQVSIHSLGGGVVEVTVADQGEGIPLEDRERIFEPFYRSSKSENQRNYGHGLGLSIAQSMVKEMGGEIWVDGKKTRGSVFRFTLRRNG